MKKRKISKQKNLRGYLVFWFVSCTAFGIFRALTNTESRVFFVCLVFLLSLFLFLWNIYIPFYVLLHVSIESLYLLIFLFLFLARKYVTL